MRSRDGRALATRVQLLFRKVDKRVLSNTLCIAKPKNSFSIGIQVFACVIRSTYFPRERNPTLESPSPRQPARSIGSSLLATFAIGRSPEGKRRPFARSASSSGSTTRPFRAATAVALAAASLLTVTWTQIVGDEPAADTGFSLPFSGPSDFECLAPTQATDPSQINQAIGIGLADLIALGMGLDKDKVLTEEQFLEFISGGGVPGSSDPEAAKLADESVLIFINTAGNPLISKVKGKLTPSVLASYGFFVTEDGWLESLANEDAPTRIANELLVPGGYIDTWFEANGATESLEQLYASAYTVEAFYGSVSQQVSGAAQLVTNTKGDDSTQVGMSMAPSIWLTNFALLYTLNPEVAAQMPAYWTPIPENVADDILKNPHGRVRYSKYASEFENSR